MLANTSRVIFKSFLLLPLLNACEANVGFTNNSSQGDNDYFEEPISDSAKKYSPALDTSNAFVEYFANGKLAEARELFDPRLKAKASEEQVQAIYEQVLDEFGPFTEYKPGQWGFAKSSSKPNMLVSVKIAIHQKSETFYVLNFEDNGRYDRIIGFKVRTRNLGERVAQAANRELQRN